MTIYGVPERVIKNCIIAKFRDPSRSIKPLDFFTKDEREIFIFTHLGNKFYEEWLDEYAHRYDTSFYELTPEEKFVDAAIRKGLK